MLCGAFCILSFKHHVSQCIQCWLGPGLLKKAEEGHSTHLCLSLHLRHRCTVFPYHYFYQCFTSWVREAIEYCSDKMSPLKVSTWKGMVGRVWLIWYLRRTHQLSRWWLKTNRKPWVSVCAELIPDYCPVHVAAGVTEQSLCKKTTHHLGRQGFRAPRALQGQENLLLQEATLSLCEWQGPQPLGRLRSQLILVSCSCEKQCS